MHKKIKIAFIAGLSDHKLQQKLYPLTQIPYIERIDLFRRKELAGDKIYWIKIPFFLRKNTYLAEIYRLLTLLLHGWKYEVFIGCFQRYHGIMAWIAGKVWGKPVIQLVITSIQWNLARPLCKKAMLAADACGVRGEISKEELRKSGYKNCIEVIHNQTDIPPAQERTYAKKYDLIAAADYAPEKDYPWMIEVVKKVKEKKKDVVVALCGSQLKKKLAERVRHYRLTENIVFMGQLTGKELENAYLASKIFINTSHTEGLPQAVIEAMGYGLACITTDAGDIPWLLRDKIDGRVVAHGDSEEMAKAIVAMLREEQILQQYSIHARQRIEILAPEFFPGSIEKQWQKLFAAIFERT